MGWTDLSRFSSFGVSAVNYGPGDPLLTHKQDEIAELRQCEERMRAWLTA